MGGREGGGGGVQDEVQVLFLNKTSLIPNVVTMAHSFQYLKNKCFFWKICLDVHFAKAHSAEGVSVASDRQNCLV